MERITSLAYTMADHTLKPIFPFVSGNHYDYLRTKIAFYVQKSWNNDIVLQQKDTAHLKDGWVQQMLLLCMKILKKV